MIILRQRIFVNLKGLEPKVAERVKAKRKTLAKNLLKVREELAEGEARLMEEAKLATKSKSKDSLTGIAGGDLISLRGSERDGLSTYVSVNRRPKESRGSMFRRYMEKRRDAISSGTKKRSEAAIKDAEQELLYERLGIPEAFREESLIRPKK